MPLCLFTFSPIQERHSRDRFQNGKVHDLTRLFRKPAAPLTQVVACRDDNKSRATCEHPPPLPPNRYARRKKTLFLGPVGPLTSVPGCPSAACKTGCSSNLARMSSRVQFDSRPSSVLVKRVGTLSTRSCAASRGLSFFTLATCHQRGRVRVWVCACVCLCCVCVVGRVITDRGATDTLIEPHA